MPAFLESCSAKASSTNDVTLPLSANGLLVRYLHQLKGEWHEHSCWPKTWNGELFSKAIRFLLNVDTCPQTIEQ